MKKQYFQTLASYRQKKEALHARGSSFKSIKESGHSCKATRFANEDHSALLFLLLCTEEKLWKLTCRSNQPQKSSSRRTMLLTRFLSTLQRQTRPLYKIPEFYRVISTVANKTLKEQSCSTLHRLWKHDTHQIYANLCKHNTKILGMVYQSGYTPEFMSRWRRTSSLKLIQPPLGTSLRSEERASNTDDSTVCLRAHHKSH